MVHLVNDTLLVSMVKDTDGSTVWPNGSRNKYDPDEQFNLLNKTYCSRTPFERPPIILLRGGRKRGVAAQKGGHSSSFTVHIFSLFSVSFFTVYFPMNHI